MDGERLGAYQMEKGDQVLKIAIVDDDASCIKAIESHLKYHFSKENDRYDVSGFANGLQFMEDRQKYDIIFLDIDMPVMNGLDTAHELRRKDENAVLIFVTSLAQYAIKGYEVNAFDFLLKPVSYSAFEFTMKRAEKLLSVSRKSDLVIETKEGIVRAKTEELLYVEVNGHLLSYHFIDRVVGTRGRLSDAEERLSGSRFLRCNNCYLINPQHIEAVKGYEVIVGRDTLAISHPRRKQFMEELGKWYAEFGG